MPRAYHLTLRLRVVYLKTVGYSYSEIWQLLHVSRSFVKKITRLYRNTLDVVDQPWRKGRQRCITANENLLIRQIITEQPELYLDEIQSWLHFLTGEVFALQTINRCIGQMGLTVKKLQVIARERNEVQRAQFRRFVSAFRKEQFIFLDESSKDERTTQRKYARSLRGTRISKVGNFTRGTRYSVLAGVSIQGIKAAHAIVGSYDKEQFEFVVENYILPHLGSYAHGEDCSIVVLDNCRIHQSSEALRMIRSKGALLVFLPPYSPDMNPIEECFSVAKRWMMRHQDICDSYPQRCFEIALENISPDACTSLIEDCGYM